MGKKIKDGPVAIVGLVSKKKLCQKFYVSKAMRKGNVTCLQKK